MTIQAGGETWHKSTHVRDLSATHPEVFDHDLAYVLDNWLMVGEKFNTQHNAWQRHYMAIVPEENGPRHMVRVVTETAHMQGVERRRIVTAFRDGKSTRHWLNGNMEYFYRRYRDLEVRYA